MNEVLICLKTAKLAHAKGLDLEDCQCIFPNENGEEELTCPYFLAKRSKQEWYRIPSQSLLQKWLRDVHGINIGLTYFKNPAGTWWSWRLHYMNEYGQHKTYEDALEAALLAALNQIQ